MNLNPFQKSSFESRLAYFGGAITAEPLAAADEFQDLEGFFVEATLMMTYDVRVTSTFLNWLIRYGAILCPSKIRRMIRATTYHPAVLGAFVSYLKEYDPRPQRWRLLTRFTKKSNFLLFEFLPAPRQKNPHFEKFGIQAPLLAPNESKYLLPKEAVLRNCVELRYRSMLMGTVAADVHSIFEKKQSSLTPYQIAKITHHHKAQVYTLIKTMERLGSRAAPSQIYRES